MHSPRIYKKPIWLKKLLVSHPLQRTGYICIASLATHNHQIWEILLDNSVWVPDILPSHYFSPSDSISLTWGNSPFSPSLISGTAGQPVDIEAIIFFISSMACVTLKSTILTNSVTDPTTTSIVLLISSILVLWSPIPPIQGDGSDTNDTIS